jgi:hypothetical protein
MNVHLVDGTYELFRYFYAPGDTEADAGEELRGVRGVVSSMLGLLGDATHVGVATDHVIESFRNDLWPGYKTGAGIDPALFAQFHPLERALESLGLVVWAMVEQEADDALAAAAAVAEADGRVGRAFVCSPDKDLAQCVRGGRIVQLDRRLREVRDESGVVAKFGVAPRSIPDCRAGQRQRRRLSRPARLGLEAAATQCSRATAPSRRFRAVAEWDEALRRRALGRRARRAARGVSRTLARLRTDAPVGRVDARSGRGARRLAETRCG